MATDATFVTNIDLSNLELRNAKAHILSADPAAVEGKIIYNSTAKQLKYHDGTSWVSAGGAPLANLSGQAAAFGQAAANGSATTAARSDHYHALPAVPALNSIPVPTGAVAMNGQKITGLAAGTTNGDAIRYEQLVGQYLPIGGGNLTGNLGLTNTGIDWKNASNVKRWNARLAGTEGGSESGAMLTLFSYTDAGVESAGLVQIDRGSGSTYVAGTLRSATGMSVGNQAGVGQIQVQPAIGSYTGFTLRNGTSGTDMFTLDVYDSAAYVSGTLKYLDAGSWLFNKPVGMGSNKITGLAAATANGDAVRYEQLTSKADTNQTMYIGTTAVAINRSSASLSLTGVNIDGSAGSATSATNATNATNVAVTDNTTTNGTKYVSWVDAASGNNASKVSSTKLTFNPSTGVLSATGFSGAGGSLTGLTAGNLSGTIPSAVLGNSSLYIGTTQVALNRGSGSLSLAGISGITMTGAIAMGGSKITGLAAGTATGDAARYDELNALSGTVTSVQTTANNALPKAGGTMSGAIAMGSNKITGLADGTNPQDAATVAQVQAAATGLDVKASVRAVIASNIDPGDSSYANSTYADGVAVAVDERVLLIGQTNPAENGIWIKKPGTTGMLRGSDADTSAKVTPNMFVFVESGTNYADTGWVLTTDGPITLGTTGLTFTQFSGPGQYVWGNGLANSGRTVNVGAGTGITVAADTVSIDTAVVARKSSTTLSTSATSYVVTHNLNTRDVQVSVVQVGSPYGVVYTAWEATSVNTVTVYFATAPTANTLRVNVVG
jgi:hypothetical protein